MIRIITILFLILVNNIVFAYDFYEYKRLTIPSLLVDSFIIIDKKDYSMSVYTNDKGVLRYKGSYIVSYGEKKGDKRKRGDLKTPEGFYYISGYKSKDLLESYGRYNFYGESAFVLNYPNKIDRRKGKTGGGIWIHGEHFYGRYLKKNVTRGCVISSNDNIKELKKNILNKKVLVLIANGIDNRRIIIQRKEGIDFVKYNEHYIKMKKNSFFY